MQDGALLTFFLGPVQPFIEAARTVRDLWTGSYLLSWLTASAMKPVIQECDEQAILSPSLEGNRVLDAVLGRLSPDHRYTAMTPCSPNRFVARVPADKADGLAQACEAACRSEWEDKIAGKVRDELRERFSEHDPHWGRNWDPQIRSYFEIRTAVLPLADSTEEVLARLGVSTPELGWPPLDVLAGVLDALKSVRHVPAYEPQGDDKDRFPPKCSLLGSYEQMGPAELDASAAFWRDLAEKGKRYRGTWLSRSDRLCAVSLVKRFAWPCYLAGVLGLRPEELRFSDSYTVAARLWLKADPPLSPEEVRRRYGHWSGLWLHWSSQHQEPDEEECPRPVWNTIRAKRSAQGKPPIYYVILMMDGDHLGKLFRGVDGDTSWGRGEERARSISTRLTAFAVNEAEQLVEATTAADDPHGELIYSGGDDTLAVLPTQTALACANRLRAAYEDAMRGDKPHTVSAGLAVVHVKEDLRFALQQAREAEKASKAAGRNALTIAVCRRSGEHTRATLGWGQVGQVQGLVEAFAGKDGEPGVSDRWAYKLRGEVRTLRNLPRQAVRAELGRLLGRVEGATERQQQGFRDAVLNIFDGYHAEMTDQGRGENKLRWRKDDDAITDFVTLCQSASFLARGRDE
jgi:CRISPR-associated protein Cmr2